MQLCCYFQLSLQSMVGGSAASSFADDIIKWQKTLQNLEAVLNLWWEAQQKWIKLDDVSFIDCSSFCPIVRPFLLATIDEYSKCVYAMEVL